MKPTQTGIADASNGEPIKPESLPDPGTSFNRNDPLETQLFDYIRHERHVSFANIEFMFGRGTWRMALESNENIVLWETLPAGVIDALNTLLDAKRIVMTPTLAYIGGIPLVYLADGRCLRWPLVRSGHPYTTPHWLPVTFDVPGRGD